MYRLEKKLRIFEPELWGEKSVESAISPDGQLIAIKTNKDSDFDDNRDNIFIYNLDGIPKFSLRNPPGPQEGFSFIDNYHIITATAGFGMSLRKYELGRKRDFSELYQDKDARGVIELKAVSNGGYLFLYQTLDQLVWLYGSRKILEIERQRGMNKAQFSPNGKYLAINGNLSRSEFNGSHNIVLSAETYKMVWSADDGVFLCFSNDSKNLAVWGDASEGKSILGPARLEIWDTKTWTKISQSQDNWAYTLGRSIERGVYSPDDKIIATVGGHYDAEVICLWDTTNFRIVGEVSSPHGTRIENIKFTFDSKELITIGKRDVIVWQIHKEQTGGKNVEVHIHGDANNSNFVVGDDNEVTSK